MQRAAMLSPVGVGAVGGQSAPSREVAGSGRRGRGGSKAGPMRALHDAMGHTHCPASSTTAVDRATVPPRAAMRICSGTPRNGRHHPRCACGAARAAARPAAGVPGWVRDAQGDSTVWVHASLARKPTTDAAFAVTTPNATSYACAKRPLRRPHPAAMPGAWPVSERQVPGRIHATPVGRGKAGDAAVEEAIHVQLVGDVLDL